jgi:hypothetical protein
MVPPMKIAHPRQSPNTLNIKMELTQRPWRLLSLHCPPNAWRLARYCCRYYHATIAPTPILSGRNHVGATCLSSSTRHPRDWVEGTYYIYVR